MRAIRESIGGADVLFQLEETDYIELVDEDGDTLIPISIGDTEIKNAYSHAKELIEAIAQDMGQKAEMLLATSHMNQLELSFSLSFSAETNIWVIKAGGTGTFAVSMGWERSP